MGYYVYKYVNTNNDIIYIGRTINLQERIEKQHKRDKLKDFQGTVYYFECPNKTAMISYEYMLTNKYHPIYNEQNNHKNINININEPEWKIYININEQKVINLTNYFKSTKQEKNMENKKEESSTIIISDRKKIRFICQHWGAELITTNWFRTKGRQYSASCPCCPYSAWAK